MKFFRHLMHSMAMVIMPKSLQKKMTSCQEVAQLIANNDCNSSIRKIQIEIHTMMCQSCADYEQQIKIINKECKEMHKIFLTPEHEAKIKNSKEDILKKFNS